MELRVCSQEDKNNLKNYHDRRVIEKQVQTKEFKEASVCFMDFLYVQPNKHVDVLTVRETIHKLKTSSSK